jgi:hypothetical protein
MARRDDAAGRSHAFDDWNAIDSDIRSYLELSDKNEEHSHSATTEHAGLAIVFETAILRAASQSEPGSMPQPT